MCQNCDQLLRYYTQQVQGTFNPIGIVTCDTHENHLQLFIDRIEINIDLRLVVSLQVLV